MNASTGPAGSRATTRGGRLRQKGPDRREAGIVSAEAVAAYVEDFLPEDEPLLAARRSAAEVGGASPVSPAVGATLRFIAAALSAKAVVEIGTGCGTSGIWLLRGMRRDAVLTSVDVEPEHQRLARRGVTEAGVEHTGVPTRR